MICVNGEYKKAINLDNAIKLYKEYKFAAKARNQFSKCASQKEMDRLQEDVEKAERAYYDEVAPIDKTIKAVEGKARERTISATDVVSAVIAYIDYLNIPQKAMSQIKITIDCNSQDKPKAYKYKMMNTIVMVVRNGNHWWLSTIERAENQKHMYSVYLPPEAQKAIIEHNYINRERYNVI